MMLIRSPLRLALLLSLFLLPLGNVLAIPLRNPPQTNHSEESVLYGNTALYGLYVSVGGGYMLSANKLGLIDRKHGNAYAEEYPVTGLAPIGLSALGYDLNRNFHIPIRTEFTYSYQGKYNVDNNMSRVETHTNQVVPINHTNQFRTQTLFWNTYYDLHSILLGHFVPYVGLGFGLAQNHERNRLSNSEIADGDASTGGEAWGLAWDTVLGGDYFLTSHWAIGAQWRLANLGPSYYETHKNNGSPHIVDSPSWAEKHTLSSDMFLLVRYEF